MPCRLGADSAYRACVNACTAVDAGVSVDNTLVALLADGVYRAGVVTCAAVDALVGNFVSQRIHPLYILIFRAVVFTITEFFLARVGSNVQKKPLH